MLAELGRDRIKQLEQKGHRKRWPFCLFFPSLSRSALVLTLIAGWASPHRELRRRGYRDLVSRCGPRSGGRGLFEAGFAHCAGASEFRRPARCALSAVEPEHLSRAG